jgi:PAS domain S-box-containing protein
MKTNEQAARTGWGSLSLRLSAVFVAGLVAAAFAMGYLFDRELADAAGKRELQHLQLGAERGADELARHVAQLRADVLFLAGTPPVQGIWRAQAGGGMDTVGGSSLGQWKERLERIFLSFAETRPEYFQLRLIGAQDNGRELTRVERTAGGLRVTPAAALQQKGERYYFREAARLSPGGIYLSPIDLNQEHGQISVPHVPTLRAATPVHDAAGNLFGVVVLNMDLRGPFEHAESFRSAGETVYIADEQGNFLRHPEPGRAFAFEFGTPFRLFDAFPEDADQLASALAAGDGFVELDSTERPVIGYVTTRPLTPEDPGRRLAYLVAEPKMQAFHATGLLSRNRLLAVGTLLALAIALVVLMVYRLTHALKALADASEAISGGDYRTPLPATGVGEIGRLVVSFGRMAEEVARREEALADLNRVLEQRVAERTAELTRQHALQQSILENIADGVVVADRDGRFLLWNRRAEQIVGAGPDQVAPERWTSHFGLFRNEAGDSVPTPELPLLRAIRGESCDNVELYLHNPKGDQGRWVQITARPLRDEDGAVAGGVAVILDVTENMRLRQREASHRAELAKVGRLAIRAEIASSAAHEMSQPIAAMSNYAGAALRLHRQGRLGDGELVDLMTRIEGLANQAGEILNRLRMLIRRQSRPLAPVDINQVAESCLDFLDERIRQQGIRVERRYGRDLPKPFGDPIELEHVLIQLVSNALEAMEGIAVAERRLSIATEHDPAAALVGIEVADTGRGVSPALADRLFEPWQTDKPDALGIGLSVAQSIIETCKGRIRMTNADTGGARFRIELPVCEEETA